MQNQGFSPMTLRGARPTICVMRIQLDVYADGGHLHGQLRTPEQPEPVAFSGVLDLVAALEALGPEPGPEWPIKEAP
jgi:hypothetical protein